MHILFLNQYFPPDPAPTGVLLKELAQHLEAAGHTVDFVAAGQNYRAAQKKDGRMRRELGALAHMLVEALRRPRADVVLSATSPPCLLVVATLAAVWHRAKSLHWVMDLYPDIAVALDEIPASGLRGILRRFMDWCYRRAVVVVALDEDMAARLRAPGVRVEIIRPWVFASVLPVAASAHGEPEAPWTWIYSGNLGRAHEWETLLAAQAILEQRGAGIRLLFQGGGPSWPAAQARARELGLRECDWTGYIEESELPAALRRAQVLAVTQRPAAQGLLWPSKLGLILSLPRPILWIGPTEGAVAQFLRTRPNAGIFAPGDAEAVADWLQARKQNPRESINVVPLDAQAHREAALSDWLRLLEA